MKNKVVAALLVVTILLSSSTFFVTSSATPDGYDLLIIAPEEFIDVLKPLKDFKDATNRPTRLMSLADVYAGFDGVDTAEELKNCIAYYESMYGIEYVLLVGDSDKLPVRYIYTKIINTTENTVLGLNYVPTDLYYADLYYEGTSSFCSWDSNGNGFYGERIYDFAGGSWHEPVLNIDDLDLRPDVAVGRVPASTVIQADRYVDKSIAYELDCSPGLPWFKTALFVSGVDGGMWNADTLEIPQLNTIATLLEGLGFTTIKLYDASYPSDGVPNPTSINSHLNSGVGFMNIHCHGSRGGWDGVYGVPGDMAGLNNQDKLPIIYSMSCLIGAYAPLPHNEQYIGEDDNPHTITYVYPVLMADFVEPIKPNPVQDSTTDQHSPSEYFLVSYDTKGAIASIAPSDVALMGNTEYLNTGFFEGYETGLTVLGDVWNYGIDYYCDNYWATPASGKGGSMSKLARYHLFGDPSLAIGGLPDKPPTTTKTVGVPCYEDTFVFVTSSTLHTLTATDDNTIEDSYYRYYLQGSTPLSYETYTGPFVIIGDDGPYVIEYYSVDDGGNWDFPIKSQIEYLDNTPPETTLTIGSPQYTDGGNTYVTSSTPFTLAASDGAGSGVASTEYRINLGPWTPYTGAFTLSGLDGPYVIDYRSTDNLDNVEPTNSETVILDNTPPTVRVVAPPDGYVYGQVTIQIEATDAGSGVDYVWYSLDESIWVPTTFNLASGYYEAVWDTSLISDGDYTVYARAFDNLGNEGRDPEPPEVTVVHLELSTGFTDSRFNPIEEFDAIFSAQKPTMYKLSTNPGTFYQIIEVTNTGTTVTLPSLTLNVSIPQEADFLGPGDPAFTLIGAKPVHIYLNGAEVTPAGRWLPDLSCLSVEQTLSPGDTVKITIHYEYAFKGNRYNAVDIGGWTGENYAFETTITNAFGPSWTGILTAKKVIP